MVEKEKINDELEDSSKKETEDSLSKKKFVKETSVEEKLKDTEDKLLRSLAEIENQRRRF